ncbi:MAG: hypothetical protein IJU72_09625 [Bacteroidales bacterium]|nr:hypothetical protein [Bacteroidales bacterium]
MIYKFRMLASGDRAFLRDYEIDSEARFIDLHGLLQCDLGLDTSQLASFFVADDQWNKGLELTLLDMGTPEAAMPMESAKLSDLLKNRTDRLLYAYDMFADQHLFLELIAISEPQPNVMYPRCAASVGEPPAQPQPDLGLPSLEPGTDDYFADDDQDEVDFENEDLSQY